MTTRPLPSDQHAIYELAPGLLLVFKPRGHSERVHTHSHTQRLRVIRGRLRVTTDDVVVTIDAASDPLTLAAQTAHATEALVDTWLIAETVARA